MISPRRRIISILLVVVSLGALVGFGRLVAVGDDRAEAWQSGFSPIAQIRSSGIDSSWVCGGATLVAGATSTTPLIDQPLWVSVLNAGASSTDVTLDILFDASPARPVPATQSIISLSPGERRDLKVVDLVAQLPAAEAVGITDEPTKTRPGAVYASVAVRSAAPDVVVSYATGLTQSLRWSPCATSPNRRWFVPTGTTRKDAAMLLLLTNPFDDVATVDLGIRSEAGYVEPPDFSGIVVNPHSTRVINVGDHVRRRETVAVDAFVRNGRAVVSWIQSGGVGGAQAVTSGLAANGASTTLRWAGLQLSDGATYQLAVFNSSATESSSVEVLPLFAGGEAFPFTVELGPHEQRTIDLSNDPRIPRNVDVALQLDVVAGAAVVGTLVYQGVAPASRRGTDATNGLPVDAHRWIVPVVDTSDEVATSLSVFNPNDVAIAFTVREFVGAEQLDFGVAATTYRTVEPKQSLTVSLDEMRVAQGAVSVESTGAVAIVVTHDNAALATSTQSFGVMIN